MQDRDAVARLERLGDAFEALVVGTLGLSVDRHTGSPAGAVGWERQRNFRVRLASRPAGAQASVYVRMQGAPPVALGALAKKGEAHATHG